MTDPKLTAADGRAALLRIMDRTRNERTYADCDIAYKAIDALDAARPTPPVEGLRRSATMLLKAYDQGGGRMTANLGYWLADLRAALAPEQPE